MMKRYRIELVGFVGFVGSFMISQWIVIESIESLEELAKRLVLYGVKVSPTKWIMGHDDHIRN